MTDFRIIEIAFKHGLISSLVMNEQNRYDAKVLSALTDITKQVKAEALADKYLVESKRKAYLLERIKELELSHPSEAMDLTHQFLKG